MGRFHLRALVGARRSKDVQIEVDELRERRNILSAVLLAVTRPHEIVDIVAARDDSDSAARELARRLDLSDVQARAVLDTQYRRLSARDRVHLEDDLREVQARIERGEHR